MLQLSNMAKIALLGSMSFLTTTVQAAGYYNIVHYCGSQGQAVAAQVRAFGSYRLQNDLTYPDALKLCADNLPSAFSVPAAAVARSVSPVTPPATSYMPPSSLPKMPRVSPASSSHPKKTASQPVKRGGGASHGSRVQQGEAIVFVQWFATHVNIKGSIFEKEYQAFMQQIVQLVESDQNYHESCYEWDGSSLKKSAQSPAPSVSLGKRGEANTGFVLLSHSETISAQDVATWFLKNVIFTEELGDIHTVAGCVSQTDISRLIEAFLFIVGAYKDDYQSHKILRSGRPNAIWDLTGDGRREIGF